MGRTQFGLMLWAAMALFSCKTTDKQNFEVSGRLMKNTTDGIDGLSLELVEMQFYPNTNSSIETVHDTYLTREGGKFRFTYEISNRDVEGITCTDNNEGLYLRNATTGKYYFKCFPTNKDIYSLIYTGKNSLLTISIADTLSAGDTLFVPYAPLDSADAHYIVLTDTAGNSYPYFFLVGPQQPQSLTLETMFNNNVYEGLFEYHHGQELFQWFVKGDTNEHYGLETWRPRGLPYRDTILLHNLYR